FRDQLIAASLKLRDGSRIWCTFGRFPRSIDRGLIEASADLKPTSTPTNFRDQLIAASLKRLSSKHPERYNDHFRDQLIAASLKSDLSQITNIDALNISAIN